MFAIIKTGGKQYKVTKGDVLKIEKIDGAEGDIISFDQVLLVGDSDKQTVGSPIVEGAVVKAEMIAQARARKITVFKKKRRQNYRRKKGHRQHMTILRVTEVVASGAKKAAPVKAAEGKAPAEKAEAKKTVAKKATAKKATTKKAAAKKPAAKKD